VGGGVIGLTTAVVLAERGRRVRVWTRDAPQATTSAVAGALWWPYRIEPAERVGAWALATLRTYEELAADPAATGVRMAAGTHADTALAGLGPWAGEVAGLRQLASGALAARLPLIDMPVHLAWLRSRLEAAGGTVERRGVTSFAPAAARAPVVVNCTGLGARELVPDPSLRPVRGQLVLVENPGIEEWFTAADAAHSATTYFFPQPGRHGRGRRRAYGTRRPDGRGDRRPVRARPPGHRARPRPRAPGGPAPGTGGRGTARRGAPGRRRGAGAQLRPRRGGRDGGVGLRTGGGVPGAPPRLTPGTARGTRAAAVSLGTCTRDTCTRRAATCTCDTRDAGPRYPCCGRAHRRLHLRHLHPGRRHPCPPRPAPARRTRRPYARTCRKGRRWRPFRGSGRLVRGRAGRAGEDAPRRTGPVGTR
jgi:D-amino-acid oxidase